MASKGVWTLMSYLVHRMTMNNTVSSTANRVNLMMFSMSKCSEAGDTHMMEDHPWTFTHTWNYDIQVDEVRAALEDHFKMVQYGKKAIWWIGSCASVTLRAILAGVIPSASSAMQGMFQGRGQMKSSTWSFSLGHPLIPLPPPSPHKKQVIYTTRRVNQDCLKPKPSEFKPSKFLCMDQCPMQLEAVFKLASTRISSFELPIFIYLFHLNRAALD